MHTVGVGVGVRVGVGVSVSVGVSVLVADASGVSVSVGPSVAVFADSAVGVQSSLSVALGSSVSVGSGVPGVMVAISFDAMSPATSPVSASIATRACVKVVKALGVGVTSTIGDQSSNSLETLAVMIHTQATSYSGSN